MEQFVPAAGQGILAVEIRQGELGEIMKAIHSVETEAELTAEREFLTILGGGMQRALRSTLSTGCRGEQAFHACDVREGRCASGIPE